MKWLFLSLCFCFASTNLFALDHFALRWVNHSGGQTEFDSEKFPDTIFVINYFLSGCKRAHLQEPAIIRLSRDYASDHRIKILEAGFNENDKTYAEWIKKYQLQHPVLDDKGYSLYYQLKTEGAPEIPREVPFSYLIDCKGRVRFLADGIWNKATEQRIRDVIDELLNGECSGNSL